MNLQRLFEIQGGLDAHITKEKGLEGQDLLPQKILALQVELGELANEWRGFKFWSEDREPRTEKKRHVTIPGYKAKGVEISNPLLEEYVDCLHFILSIGLELEVDPKVTGSYLQVNSSSMNGLEDKFLYVSKKVLNLYEDIRDKDARSAKVYWLRLLEQFLGIGVILGFTEDEIESAYLDKNRINHERQINGY